MIMKTYRTAIIGLGASGTMLAAAMVRKDPNTILVGRSNDIIQAVAYSEKAGERMRISQYQEN